jgi:secreted trypsin-like serine protease
MSRYALPTLFIMLATGCVQDLDRAQYETSTHPIVHGLTTAQGGLFGTVALALTADGEQDCTGTLIAPSLVVTAAHCIYDLESQRLLNTPETYQVIAGALSIADAGPEHIYAIDELIYHEGFPMEGPTDTVFEDIGMGQGDDIGLVVLKRPVDTVDVIPVLPQSLTDTVLSEGKGFTISGYGTRDLEGMGDSGVLYTAQQIYRDRTNAEFWGGNISSYAGCDADSDCPTGEVCVWSECTATDTCSGDSGGPVYVEVDGTTYLVGIVSRGVQGSLTYCGEGGIYTLANFYDDWLTSNGQTLYPPEDTEARLPAPSGSDSDGDGDTSDGPTDADAEADDPGCHAGGGSTPAWPLLVLMVFAPSLLSRRRAPRPLSR